MKSLGNFILFIAGLAIFISYTMFVTDLARESATRTVIDKDLCYPINSQQGQYIGFKLTLDKGYTAYICKGKVE